MSLTIARNFVKYFGECPQTFRGISTSIPENVVKHVSSNILGNVSKRSGECRQTFQGMSSNIPGNVVKHSRECPQTFQGMSSNIPGNVRVTQGNEGRRVSRGFHLVVFVFGVNQDN